jgi:hypothetical protein
MVVVKDYGVQDGTTRGVLYLLREGTAESFGVLDGSTEMRSSRLDVSRILGSSPMRTSPTSAEFRVMVRRARCRVVDTLSAKSFCIRSQFPICVKNWACSDGVLPLAKRVFRERSGCLPNVGTSSPPRGGETETDWVLGEGGNLRSSFASRGRRTCAPRRFTRSRTGRSNADISRSNRSASGLSPR